MSRAKGLLRRRLGLLTIVCLFVSLMKELWGQLKNSSSEDSKLQGMVESLEKMLRDSESKYQVSKDDEKNDKNGEVMIF